MSVSLTFVIGDLCLDLGRRTVPPLQIILLREFGHISRITPLFLT